MRVAVLGAAATITRAIVRDLAESDELDRVLLLDRDEPGARAVAAEQAAGRAEVAAVEHDERFIAAERIAVLGIGASPGKTNVMSLRAVRELEPPAPRNCACTVDIEELA